MFSSKSKRLFEIIDREEHAHQKILKLAPVKDDRAGKGVLSARSKNTDEFDTLPANAVGSLKDIVELMQKEHYDVIAFDEAQFFDKWLIKVIEGILYNQNGFQNVAYSRDLRVIVSGLDMDFERQPFEVMSHLAAIADKVYKLPAICCKCRNPIANAILTQKLTGGDERIQVGDKDIYEARCRSCHYVYSSK